MDIFLSFSSKLDSQLTTFKSSLVKTIITNVFLINYNIIPVRGLIRQSALGNWDFVLHVQASNRA